MATAAKDRQKFMKEQEKQRKKDDKLRKLVEKKEAKDRKKSGIVGGVISQPKNFNHDSHVGWSTDGGFEIRNIPDSWQKLFTAAGMTEDELNDPETRAAMVATMQACLDGDSQPEMLAPDEALAQRESIGKTRKSGKKKGKKKGKGSKTGKAKGTSSGKDPRAPPRSDIPASGGGPAAPAPPPAPNAPPPPPAPTAPAAPAAPSAPGGPPKPKDPVKPGDEVQAIYAADGAYYKAQVVAKDPKGWRINFVEYGEEAVVSLDQMLTPDGEEIKMPKGGAGGGGGGGGGGAGGLAGALGQVKLKKAEERELDVSTLPVNQTADILTSLQNTLNARRAGMMMSTYGTGEEEDDNEDWEDEESDWMQNY